MSNTICGNSTICSDNLIVGFTPETLDTTMWQLNSTPDLSDDLSVYIDNGDVSWNTCEYYDNGDVKIASWSFDYVQVRNGYILWYYGAETPTFIYCYNSQVFDALVAQFEAMGFTIDQSDLTSKSGYFYIKQVVNETTVKLYNVRRDVIRFNSDDWDRNTGFTNWLTNSAEQLDEYIIPNDVIVVGLNAFYNCNSFETITIPDSVTSIGHSAFYGCSSLTSIDIPDSVTSIGVSAFMDCSSLTNVTIGNSVTSIEYQAFYGCSSLTSVTIKATTPPAIGYYLFDNTNDCPIYVTSQSVNAYKTAWSDYANRIQAMPITAITLDLSTIGLTIGTHSIQMKLSDDGATKVDSELSNAVTYVQYQQLTAPVISRSGDILSWSAVPNASSYRLYVDNVSQGAVTSGIDLTTLQLAVGSHSIQVMAIGSGYYTNSELSNAVSCVVYTITPTLTNVTADSGNPTTILSSSNTSLRFTENSGYELPDSVTVTGATGLWMKALGFLFLSHPTSNVTFSIVGEQILPQLDAPTNLTADGTTISFDPVENAESYEVFVDGVSIGTYTPQPEPTGETWVINENPTISTHYYSIAFVSNNISFEGIDLKRTTVPIATTLLQYDDGETLNVVYDGSSWTDQAYRTVTFETATTGDLLTWLQANAVKQ